MKLQVGTWRLLRLPREVNSLLVVLSDAQDHGGSVLDLWICDDGQTI